MDPRLPLSLCCHFIDLVCVQAQDLTFKIRLQWLLQMLTKNKRALAVPFGLETMGWQVQLKQPKLLCFSTHAHEVACLFSQLVFTPPNITVQSLTELAFITWFWILFTPSFISGFWIWFTKIEGKNRRQFFNVVL